MLTALLAALLALSQAGLPDVSDGDLAHLPPPEVVAAALDVAATRCQFLWDRHCTHGWGWGLRDAYADACWRRACWQALGDAQKENLKNPLWMAPGDPLRWLRGQLGPVAFYRGELPPVVYLRRTD